MDEIPDQASVTGGSWSYERLFGAATRDFMNGHILSALELVHYDGPWTHPDNVRKINAVLRYSEGEAREGYSITAMYYRGLWNATTDQPERAMDPAYMASLGLTPISRFGTLDPTDGGTSSRFSLSGNWAQSSAYGQTNVSAYVVRSDLRLFNNFTYFLGKPVLGDQFHQHDDRLMAGANIARTLNGSFAGLPMQTTIGLQSRNLTNRMGITGSISSGSFNTQMYDAQLNSGRLGDAGRTSTTSASYAGFW